MPASMHALSATRLASACMVGHSESHLPHACMVRRGVMPACMLRAAMRMRTRACVAAEDFRIIALRSRGVIVAVATLR